MSWLEKLLEAIIKAIAEWIVRCIPQYNPAAWNDSNGIEFNNNCYNYGCDIQTGTYAQPGRATGNQYNNINCIEVGNGAQSDGLAPVDCDEGCGCRECCHQVALVIAPGFDYHWYRKDRDGRWSHKMGGPSPPPDLYRATFFDYTNNRTIFVDGSLNQPKRVKGYDIIPGPDDGVATASPDWPYPRGDVWILRYHGSELDDGVNCTTGGFGCVTEANLDGFVNGEAISNNDVVVWYAGHVTHDVAHEEPGEFGHICGPDLKPVNW